MSKKQRNDLQKLMIDADYDLGTAMKLSKQLRVDKGTKQQRLESPKLGEERSVTCLHLYASR